VSSGERKRMMVKPCACDDPAGVARAVLLGRAPPVAAAAGRSEVQPDRVAEPPGTGGRSG